MVHSLTENIAIDSDATFSVARDILNTEKAINEITRSTCVADKASSKELQELQARLRNLEMQYNIISARSKS